MKLRMTYLSTYSLHSSAKNISLADRETLL